MESKFESSSYRESKAERVAEAQARWEEEQSENPFAALPGSTDSSVLVRAAIWFGDGDRTTLLNDFVEKNCCLFASAAAAGLTSDGSGHSMECHQAHQDFLALFERQIETFISEEGFTMEAFRRDCAKALEGESLTLIDSESHKWFVDALMSSLDYSRFHSQMVAAVRKQQGGRSKRK